MRKRMKDDELKKFVSRLNGKREKLLFQLLNMELKRREMQKQLERRMRKRPLPVMSAEELLPVGPGPKRVKPEVVDELDDGIPESLRRPTPVAVKPRKPRAAAVN